MKKFLKKYHITTTLFVISLIIVWPLFLVISKLSEKECTNYTIDQHYSKISLKYDHLVIHTAIKDCNNFEIHSITSTPIEYSSLERQYIDSLFISERTKAKIYIESIQELDKIINNVQKEDT